MKAGLIVPHISVLNRTGKVLNLHFLVTEFQQQLVTGNLQSCELSEQRLGLDLCQNNSYSYNEHTCTLETKFEHDNLCSYKVTNFLY
jgi:hypothetical protein